MLWRVFCRVRRADTVFPEREHLSSKRSTRHRSEEVGCFIRWIEELDPLNKALVLLYLDGNNYQETAAVLGISETNVATKISRLKEALRQKKEVQQHGTR